MQGEVWPNRCSEAIDEANSRISTLCEDSPHLHYIDLGSVSPPECHRCHALLAVCSMRLLLS